MIDRIHQYNVRRCVFNKLPSVLTFIFLGIKCPKPLMGPFCTHRKKRRRRRKRRRKILAECSFDFLVHKNSKSKDKWCVTYSSSIIMRGRG
jgi:hypothetical protein